MQKIPLNLAGEGMVLAKPVTRDNGMVLLAEGTEISPALLDRLERMGVTHVTVEGNPVDMEGATAGSDYGAMVERLDHLFRKHQADPWMQKLKGHVEKFFQLKAAEAAAAKAAAEAAKAAAEAEAEANGENGENGGNGKNGEARA